MKKRFLSLPMLAALFLCGGAGLLLTGCTTTEPENASARPWNSPNGWQYGQGIPAGLLDQRR
jgi:hypothetical protein